MTAKVTELFMCPKCSEAISGTDRPERCVNPMCGYKFASEQEGLTKEYFWPKSFFDQLYELTQQDMEENIDKPISKLLPGITKEQEEEIRVSNKQRLGIIQKKRISELEGFLLKSSPTDVENWFKCLHYLMSICVSSGNEQLVGTVCSLGEKIGTLAKAIKDYKVAGGKIYATPVSRNSKGDTKKSK